MVLALPLAGLDAGFHLRRVNLIAALTDVRSEGFPEPVDELRAGLNVENNLNPSMSPESVTAFNTAQFASLSQMQARRW